MNRLEFILDAVGSKIEEAEQKNKDLQHCLNLNKDTIDKLEEKLAKQQFEIMKLQEKVKSSEDLASTHRDNEDFWMKAHEDMNNDIKLIFKELLTVDINCLNQFLVSPEEGIRKYVEYIYEAREEIEALRDEESTAS